MIKATPEEFHWIADYLSFTIKVWAKTPMGPRPTSHKESMFNVINDTFPSGFLPLVEKAAAKVGITIELGDKRGPAPAVDKSADLAWLRSYQRESVDAVLKHERGILWIPTGGGKTEVAIALVKALPSMNWLFLVHRASLMHQAADRYKLRTGMAAGMVGDGKWDVQDFTVATFQTLYKRLKQRDPRATELLGSVQGVIIDECFPAGTLVGSKPIEKIHVGDLVPSFDPDSGNYTMRRVSRRYVSRPASLVRVQFSDGRRVVCTPNHRIWTSSGWVQAGELTCGLSVLCLPYNAHRQSPSYGWQKFSGEAWLSHRHRPPRSEDRSRIGRTESLWKARPTGQTARCVTSWVRVDSIEILELGSDGKFGGLCPDGLVYNIEVEGTHTYFAEGVGVANCHTLPADSFRDVAMRTTAARYRVGLSGTPLARGDRRSQLAIAALGPVIYRIKPEVLIKAGVLAKPEIRLVPVYQESDKPTWQGVYGDCVVRSRARNKAVIAAIGRAKKPCLVFVQQIKHGKALRKALEKMGETAEFVWGSDTTEQRQGAIERLERAETDVLICSVVFQEGIDIPDLRSVVIATGGKSTIAALQRIGRGMRVAAGKTTFQVFDFDDRGNKWMVRHSKQRVKAYAVEGYTTIIEDNFAKGKS